jgi:hypothetical protein
MTMATKKKAAKKKAGKGASKGKAKGKKKANKKKPIKPGKMRTRIGPPDGG